MRFPHAMRAYLEWLAPKIGSVKELERVKDSLRDWFRVVSGHMRQPEALAGAARRDRALNDGSALLGGVERSTIPRRSTIGPALVGIEQMA